jgi:hypothetical protein
VPHTALHLLLADDAGPVLPDGATEAQEANFLGVGRLRTSYLGDPGGAPDDLAAQGWGLVLPDDSDVAGVLAALAPLIAAREHELGRPMPPPYLVPRDLESPEDWLDDVYGATSVPEPLRPRYLLLVGDLDALPVGLQQALSSVAWAGRVVGDLDALAAYAEKVAATASLAPAPPPVHLFPVQDGTIATTIACSRWLSPLGRRLQAGELGPAQVHLPPEQLWDLRDLRGRHGVLFTTSHGHHAGTTGDYLRLQGAPHLHAYTGGVLTPEDLLAEPFLPGGIWTMVACHGGGMVRDSLFRPWMERTWGIPLPRDLQGALTSLAPGGRPFVSGIVRAALAHPQGPAAVIAHVDTAWTYAFESPTDRTGSPQVMLDMVQALLARRRAGVVHRVMVDHCRSWDQRLDRLARDAVRRGLSPDELALEARLRIMRADLGSYLLFGDPAARAVGAATRPFTL